jgi:hypothetical protein
LSGIREVPRYGTSRGSMKWNPCPGGKELRKLFRDGKTKHWKIPEKEVVVRI